jgi:hypothetical protein
MTVTFYDCFRYFYFNFTQCYFKLKTFKRDAKCSERRQSSKSPHKNPMLNVFEKNSVLKLLNDTLAKVLDTFCMLMIWSIL